LLSCPSLFLSSFFSFFFFFFYFLHLSFRSSAAGFLKAVIGEGEPDAATSTMPEQARVKMGASFRSLLKIAEAEATGRTDTR
jgi:hypothetical protein